jgi:hypothetical protein
MTLKECVWNAREKKVAVGHFNISNLEGFWGVFRAAQSLDVPIIIGVSEGFDVDGFWPAFVGAIIMWLVGWIINGLLKKD